MPAITEILQTMEYGPAPEAAAPGLAWLKEHSPFGLFIGGEWVPPGGGQHFESQNPATNKPLAQVALGTAEDVDKAVAAAKAAFETWSRTPGHVRARYLYAIARQVQKHSAPASPCWSRWTTASRSARRAISIFRSSPATSTTTRAGRN